MHLEMFNPCHQRYYLAYIGDQLTSVAVVYTLQIDLLTFLNIRSPLKMHIVGIPCSVSSPGIFGDRQTCERLKDHIYKSERGLCLFLNLHEPFTPSKRLQGPTLPSVVMENSLHSWKDYMLALRADYRRRLKKIVQPLNGKGITKSDCSVFSKEMYDQYLQVYRRSTAKLEKLNFDFFVNLPQAFNLMVYQVDSHLLGWAITLFESPAYYFFMGGLDYRLNRKHKTYYRLLACIVEDAIKHAAQTIDLGQTAEIPKTRFGGRCEARYLEAGHSTYIFDRLLKISERLLVYKRTIPETHVFKRRP